MTLYLPPQYYRGDDPLIFLAGPIQGAPRWQNRAVELLGAPQSRPLHIASPRYIGKDQERIGDWTPGLQEGQQIDWETYHLAKAGNRGVVLFWFPHAMEPHSPRFYAKTSRLELGEWLARHELQGAQLALGMQPGFAGEGYIGHRFKKFPEVSIASTLAETCTRALEMALRV